MTPEELIWASLTSDQQCQILAAIKEAGLRKMQTAVSRITRILLHTNNSSLRNAAAIALMDIGDQESLYEIYSVLGRVDSVGTILYAMGGFPSPRTMPRYNSTALGCNIEDLVRRFIFNSNFEVKEMARRTLRNWNAECECENGSPIWPNGVPPDFDPQRCSSCSLILPIASEM